MMTIVTQVKIKEGHEPGWDAAFRERMEAAKAQPGFVAVQLCIPNDAINERVIIGTWENRADWAAWHGSPEFQETRRQMEDTDNKTRRETWHEVVLEGHR